MEDSRTVFTTFIVVVSAVTAYFIGPLLRLTDEGTVASFGVMLGGGAAGWWLAIHESWSRPWKVVYFLMALVGLVFLTLHVTSALPVYQANLRRCANIQREMLLPQPRRGDLPDIYQALGCHPQGMDDIQFPKQAPQKPAEKR
jgi:hypothetical protein